MADATPPAPGPVPSSPSYARGFAWTLLFNFLNKALIPIAGIIIARKLGSGPMGMYLVLQTILTFSDVFRDAGLSLAYLNDPEATGRKERSYHLVAIVVGSALAVLLAALAPWMGPYFGVPVASLLWTAVSLALNAWVTVPLAKLLRTHRFRDAGLLDMVATFISYAVALALLYTGGGFEVLVVQTVVRSVLLLALCLRTAPCGLAGYDAAAVGTISRTAGSLTGGNLLSTLYLLIDQLIVTRLFGVVSGGFYGMAKWLTSRPGEFIAAPLVRTAQVAYGHRAADRPGLARAFYKGVIAFILAVVPVQTCIAVLASPVMLAIFSTKYAASIPLVPVLSLYGAARVAGPFAGSALVALGRPGIPLVLWVVGYVVSTLAVLAWWPDMGLLGWAWLFTGGLVLVNLLTFVAAIRILPPSGKVLGEMAKAVAAVVVATAVAYAIERARLAPWLTVALSIFAIPVALIATLGMLFAGNPLAYRSPRTIRRLWRELG